MKRLLLISFALVLCLSFAACGGDEDSAPVTGSRSSSVLASSVAPQVGSSEPEPEAEPDDIDASGGEPRLIIDEYYYYDGKPVMANIIFYGDGTLYMVGVVDSTEGEYELDGNLIHCAFDHENYGDKTLTILDDYTLDDPSSGIQWIRTGGSHSGTEDPQDAAGAGPLFMIGEDYYVSGDSGCGYLMFLNESEFATGSPSGAGEGTYERDGNVLTLEFDSHPGFSLTLEMIDDYTLEDDVNGTGLVFIREGGDDPPPIDGETVLDHDGDYTLVTEDEFVQLDFYEIDNSVYYTDSLDSDFIEGTFSVEGSAVYVELENGDSIKAEIINSYMLRLDNGTIIPLYGSLFSN